MRRSVPIPDRAIKFPRGRETGVIAPLEGGEGRETSAGAAMGRPGDCLTGWVR